MALSISLVLYGSASNTEQIWTLKKQTEPNAPGNWKFVCNRKILKQYIMTKISLEYGILLGKCLACYWITFTALRRRHRNAEVNLKILKPEAFSASSEENGQRNN